MALLYHFRGTRAAGAPKERGVCKGDGLQGCSPAWGYEGSGGNGGKQALVEPLSCQLKELQEEVSTFCCAREDEQERSSRMLVATLHGQELRLHSADGIG